jgi:hypothetical protein
MRAFGLFAAFAAAILLSGQSGRASTFTYATSAGASTTGGTVSAQAAFTISNGTVTIVVTNLGANPTDVADEVSALTFDVTGATGSGSLTTVSSGSLSTLSSGGSYTAGVSSLLSRWGTTETGLALDLDALGGGSPNELIIGPDDRGGFDPTVGKYTNANSSIYNHNPSVLGTATFTIDVPGVTSSSTISDVVVQFGSSDGSNLVPAQLIPEPSTFALLGVAAIGLIGWFRATRTNRGVAAAQL